VSYTISKEFPFEASHHLNGLPDGHKCGRPHGHSYRVIVEITGDVDEVGFVIDYGDLAPVKNWIDDHLDHHDLNEVGWFPPGFNPTAEHLAYEIAVTIVQLVPSLEALRDAGRARWRVGVSETAKTWAWCDLWDSWPRAATTGWGQGHTWVNAAGPIAAGPLVHDQAVTTVTDAEMTRYFGAPIAPAHEEDAADPAGDTSPADSFTGLVSVQLPQGDRNPDS
jgi:6-pyruvoyltetrahydropterin/6-carboxytetrahydropterin synthase